MAENIKTLLKTALEDIQQGNKVLLQLLTEESRIIDDEDANNLITLLTQKEINKSLVLNAIADVAREESNSSLLAKESLIKIAVNCISSDTPDITLQALRSLCNVCATNENARTYFSNAKGVTTLMTKSKEVLQSKDDSWNKTIHPAFVCIQNIISDSEELQEGFLNANALSILWSFAEKFSTSDQQICLSAITGIGCLIDSETGLKKLEDIMVKLLNLLKNSNEDVIKAMLDKILTELGGKENSRILLCKHNTVKILSELIEARPNFKDIECTDNIMKEMADLVVILTSGEESFTILEKTDDSLLKRFSYWIESPNKHIQISAGLALGNYTRSDETCAAIVNSKIHENLINVIKENIEDEAYSDRFQAFTSCLRNLTIPVHNKAILIEAGLPEVSVTLIKTSVLPVQFKALAILRLLVQGHGDLANKLLVDKVLMQKVCELSETTAVSTVPSEAQRLIAALLKYSNSSDSIQIALSCGALKPVSSLLGSDHPLMQNEGLIGFIMTLANVDDCLPHITAAECPSKVAKLLKEDGTQAQTLFNGLTFLQALSSLDGGKALLESHQVKDIIEKIKNHSDEIVRNKAIETFDLLGFVSEPAGES